jgi:hypothetical protein
VSTTKTASGKRLVTAVGGHRLELAQPRQAALDRREVGEEPAEPALVHVEHAAALRFFGDRVLRLALGADEEHGAARGGDVGDEVGGLAIEPGGAAEVQDVNPVPLAEDVGLHLRVPTLRLVSEVDASLQQVFHGDRVQASSSPGCGRLPD